MTTSLGSSSLTSPTFLASRAAGAPRILDDENGAHILRTPGGDQEATIIIEPGSYALALKSRRPEAREFRNWVTAKRCVSAVP
ncbi:BRO-N domain-containing protein [Accumulibacter sp.]|uniref:BRO-N domain-containing protein n=1 Tax=Accumulibacter sp. TaxID=2053492 RepID=UPI003DA83E6E